MPPILANKGITLTNIGEYRLLVSTVLQSISGRHTEKLNNEVENTLANVLSHIICQELLSNHCSVHVSDNN